MSTKTQKNNNTLTADIINGWNIYIDNQDYKYVKFAGNSFYTEYHFSEWICNNYKRKKIHFDKNLFLEDIKNILGSQDIEQTEIERLNGNYISGDGEELCRLLINTFPIYESIIIDYPSIFFEKLKEFKFNIRHVQ